MAVRQRRMGMGDGHKREKGSLREEEEEEEGI